MDRSVARSVIIGIASRLLLGFGAIALVLGAITLFPGLELFGMSVSQAGALFIIVVWVLLSVTDRHDNRGKDGG